MSVGKQIRSFFRELFGSRVVETLNAQIESMKNETALRLAEKDVLSARLEEDLLRLRGDFDARLKDRDDIIVDLRANIAALQGKVFLYETTIMPHSSRMGAEIVAGGKPRKPSFTADFTPPNVKTRWQAVQEEHEAQMEKERKQDEAKAHNVEAQAAALGENNGD